eukprot:3824171-Pleurochrysis_carterae.AAC.1
MRMRVACVQNERRCMWSTRGTRSPGGRRLTGFQRQGKMKESDEPTGQWGGTKALERRRRECQGACFEHALRRKRICSAQEMLLMTKANLAGAGRRGGEGETTLEGVGRLFGMTDVTFLEGKREREGGGER